MFVADHIGWITSSSRNWHAYAWTNVGGTVALLSNSSSAYIVLAFTGALNDQGVIIPYPPLEMHHLHAQQGKGTDNLFFQSHTETQCDEGHGGVGCLIWQFPNGFGIPLTGPLNTQAEMVDVRRLGAPTFAFVAEVAVLLAIDGLSRYPISWFQFLNPFRASNLIKYKTDTFLHAKDRDTLSWFSARARSSGVLGGLGFHSHWEWTQQCQLFRAHPQQLGLLSSPLRSTPLFLHHSP